jgi:MFS family permease
VLGLAATVTAVWLSAPSLALFILGGAFPGAGGGAIFKATVATVIRISRPESRAETLTGLYLAGFVGLSLPIVGTGVALGEGVSPRVTLLAVAIGIVATAVKLDRHKRATSTGLTLGRTRAVPRAPRRTGRLEARRAGPPDRRPRPEVRTAGQRLTTEGRPPRCPGTALVPLQGAAGADYGASLPRP